jgi:hypothetical protein
MKVLVVGTVPPPGGEAAERLAAVATALIASGDTVELLSPDARSAAHRSARLGGPLLAVELALRARRFDALVLNLEPGLPLTATADRATRGITLAALGLALRAYGQVTIRLPSPIPLPGGVGGRATQALWAAASRVVVENEDDRDRILLAPGIVAANVVVEAPPEPARGTTERGYGGLAIDDGALRATVQSLVRARAASDRRVNRARAALGRTGAFDGAADPFRGVAGEVSRPSALELARLSAGKARRLTLKAVRSLQSSRD